MNFWHEVEADVSVIDIIDTGYKIFFASGLTKKFFENNRSAIENSDFVPDIIERLLNTGRIVETDAPPTLWIHFHFQVSFKFKIC